MKKITLFYGKLDETSEFHWLPHSYSLLTAPVDLNKYEVIVIDERIEKEKTDDLINKHVPDSILFGISSFTGYQLSRSVKYAKYVKKNFPQIPIVWGGPHASSLPDESLNESYVDIVVTGRGDHIINQLLLGIEHNNLNNIPGVNYVNNGEKIFGPPNIDFIDVGTTPKWNYELLKIKEYLNPKTMIINLTTSWGCTNKCTFCWWYKNKNPWSAFSAERVKDETSWFIEKFNIKQIWFNESNYFANLDRALKIGEYLTPMNINYKSTARTDELAQLDERQFKQLEKSGLNAIFIGLESGSPRVLKLMNKRIDLNEMITIAKKTRNTNINLFISLLFQIPNETIEDVKITYNFMEKIRNINPNIRAQTCSYIPLPDLPLTRLAMKQGFQPPASMENWAKVIKKSRFEKKPWLSEDLATEYENVFQELFPESELMEYDI